MDLDINKIRPTGKNILMLEHQWPDKTAGGIWLPDMLKYSETKGGKLPWRGSIIRVGKDVTQVHVGEICRYQPDNYFRNTLVIDRKRYLILDEILIYAVEDSSENLIRALKNRVVFLPDSNLEKKYGRIYLPQKHEEAHLFGTIKVAGPRSGVEVGDRCVIMNRSTWQYYSSAGVRYILTDRENLLAKVFSYCECGAPKGHSAGTMPDGEDLIICSSCKGVLKV